MSLKSCDETGVLRPLGRSRLAPSPTGAQHVGNARTFLIAWLDARCDGLEVVLRIEDLDTPRTKAWAKDQILEDLIWLGLDWDVQVPNASQRENRYREILDLLRDREQIYPCTCSRSEIEQSASAPHENSLDGLVYPGTCRERSSVDAQQLDDQGTRYAWRFRFTSGPRSWCDALYGEQSMEPACELGDFVVARNYGPTAYQLAVVVDDHDQGITRVVRGSDLIYSTYRQLALYSALGWNSPQMLHIPLVVGPDGKRLAKRHGDTRLSALREQNVAPEQLVGYLAWSLGWLEYRRPISPRELLAKLGSTPDWRSRLPQSPWVFRESDLLST